MVLVVLVVWLVIVRWYCVTVGVGGRRTRLLDFCWGSTGEASSLLGELASVLLAASHRLCRVRASLGPRKGRAH